MAHLSGSGQLVIYGSPTDVGSQIVGNDLGSGHLTTVSSAADGTPGDAPAYDAVVSANGRWVLFSSDAMNLVSGVTPGPNGTGPNLYRKDLSTGAISLAVTTSGSPNGSMSPGGISDDGNLIAFTSSATNILGVAADPALRSSGYLRDLTSGAVQRLLYQPPGSPTPGSSDAQISADGKTAAFLAMNGFGVSTDVVSCSVPALLDQGVTCASVANAFPVYDLHLAATGTALEYSAANTPESSSIWQVFRADLLNHSAGVASVSPSGVVANASTGNSGGLQGISGDGSAVFFSSTATNIDPGASDGQLHAYLRIGPQPTPTPTPTTTPTSTPTLTPPSKNAVFLGDSYSAGEGAPAIVDGAPQYISGTDQDDNRCHRSKAAYGPMIGEHLGSNFRTSFHACSGAVIADFYTSYGANHKDVLGNPKNAAEIPQLDWLTRDTGLVTLTVGGNDVGFPDIMTYCGTRNIGNNTCEQLFGKPLKKLINGIRSSKSLAKLYRDIKTRVAGDAQIVVLSYPRFFPVKPPITCFTGFLSSLFEDSDMLWINKSIADMNDVIKRAASDAGVTYVDAYGMLNGHEICTHDPWLNRVIFSLSGRSGSFHPTVRGQQAYFDAAKPHVRLG